MSLGSRQHISRYQQHISNSSTQRSTHCNNYINMSLTKIFLLYCSHTVAYFLFFFLNPVLSVSFSNYNCHLNALWCQTHFAFPRTIYKISIDSSCSCESFFCLFLALLPNTLFFNLCLFYCVPFSSFIYILLVCIYSTWLHIFFIYSCCLII